MKSRLLDWQKIRLPPLRADQKGWVYVIEVNGNVKIGWSEKVLHRLLHIQSCNPVRIKIRRLIPANAPLERELHQRWHRYRRLGEWFKIEDQLFTWLEDRCPVPMPPELPRPNGYYERWLRRLIAYYSYHVEMGWRLDTAAIAAFEEAKRSSPAMFAAAFEYVHFNRRKQLYLRQMTRERSVHRGVAK